MVKMPLPWSCLRSFSFMPASRLVSSFSSASRRQRAWNSHSAQCRFRTRSGGVELDSRASIFLRRFRTSPTRVEAFTLRAAWSSPWMILPTAVSRPSAAESTKASKASSSRSSFPSLLVKTKRIGMNWAAFPLPSEVMRSAACIRVSVVKAGGAVATMSTASRHLATFRLSAGGEISESVGGVCAGRRLVSATR